MFGQRGEARPLAHQAHYAGQPPGGGGYPPPGGAPPGYPPPGGYGYGAPIPDNSNPGLGLAIASLVLGILGFCGIYFYGAGLLLAIVGLVLGVVARRQNPRSGLALSGVIVNAVVIALACLFVGLAVFVFGGLYVLGSLVATPAPFGG